MTISEKISARLRQTISNLYHPCNTDDLLLVYYRPTYWLRLRLQGHYLIFSVLQ